jgi:hypothetical protein
VHLEWMHLALRDPAFTAITSDIESAVGPEGGTQQWIDCTGMIEPQVNINRSNKWVERTGISRRGFALRPPAVWSRWLPAAHPDRWARVGEDR